MSSLFVVFEFWFLLFACCWCFCWTVVSLAARNALVFVVRVPNKQTDEGGSMVNDFQAETVGVCCVCAVLAL